MPRFVVLFHETPAGYSRPTHFDFMLEHEGALRTWAIEKLPATGETAAAEQLADHRLAYLDYQGDISGDRGRVSRVDHGEYEICQESEATIIVQLHGTMFRGTLTLARDVAETHRWRVSFSSG